MIRLQTKPGLQGNKKLLNSENKEPKPSHDKQEPEPK